MRAYVCRYKEIKGKCKETGQNFLWIEHQRIAYDKKEFFMYKPRSLKKIKEKKVSKDSPFDKLTELRFR